MIDWERVAELRSEVGEEAFAEVVELFLEEVQEVVDRLGAAARSDVPPEPDALAADLHSLKGSALNLGFAELARLCADGELRAAAGDAAGVELPGLLSCYADSRTAFVAALGGQPVRP